MTMTRRDFLRITALTGGGLLIGISLPACASKDEHAPAPSGVFAPNAWIRIGKDESIAILVGSSEMGQGVMTAIPMLIAEELDADWSRVRAEHAPAHADYANPLMGRQATGGSTTVRGFFRPLREAGAIVREVLVSAAAKTWGVPTNECATEFGYVVHATSKRRLSYGQLTEVAATLPVPESAFVKDAKNFRILGKAMPRLDTPLKVNGAAVFGQDIKLPGLLTAVVARCPVFGGKVKSFDAKAAKQVKGVRDVVQIDAGVAVVAEHFWAAKLGRDALSVEWDEGGDAKLSSNEIRRRLETAISNGKSARSDGNVDAEFKTAAKSVEAVYEVPYLAHACMEPMNCTAHVSGDGCEIWAPTQGQAVAQHQTARVLGIKPERVKVNTTFLGGGFGRRSEFDFVSEAVQLSKAMSAPVKVLWTREDDMQHDKYRPTTLNRMRAAINAQGEVRAWAHHIAAPSILARFSPDVAKTGMDSNALEVAGNSPYAIPNIDVRFAMENTAVPVGFWRSVGASANVFVTEAFFDEVAAAARKDPLELRRQLLKDHPRHRAVLDLVAKESNWGQPLTQGRARGVAVAETFGSFVAQVAEVSVEQGRVRVHRVVCAVDCGIVVNPDIVKAQMESAIVFGLSAALKGEITLENGRVQQSNFHDYPILRLDETPRIDVLLIASDEAPGGVGEPGVPPIMPAVANAVFAATGKPVRRLPIRLA